MPAHRGDLEKEKQLAGKAVSEYPLLLNGQGMFLKEQSATNWPVPLTCFPPWLPFPEDNYLIIKLMGWIFPRFSRAILIPTPDKPSCII